MQKGYTIPALVLAISIIGVVLVGYLTLTYNQSSQGDVKGISKITGNGFSVLISSPDILDFSEYLCVSKEECEKSLVSGQKYTIISGGSTTDHELFVPYSADWREYSYLKVFIKPAWGVGQTKFSIEKDASFDAGYVTSLKDNNKDFQVLIIPLKNIMNQSLDNVAVFSVK